MLKLTYIKEFDFKKIKKYKFVIGLLLATAVAAYSNTLDVTEPLPDPITIEVPGPTEYINVPGATEYVNIPCDPCPPVELCPEPCSGIWSHFKSPAPEPFENLEDNDNDGDNYGGDDDTDDGDDNDDSDDGDDNDDSDDSDDGDDGDDNDGGCNGHDNHGSGHGRGHGGHGKGQGHRK